MHLDHLNIPTIFYFVHDWLVIKDLILSIYTETSSEIVTDRLSAELAFFIILLLRQL
jgi:hypothetical protein